jgi:hypothetical protein
MKIFLILVVVFFVFVGPVFSDSQQQDWQIPVFATDQAGNPIIDLKDKDIQFQVNGKPVKNFKLIKKPVSAAAEQIVFLLFDIAMSGEESIDRAKEIARGIVTGAEQGTRFVLMAIKPFGGLTFIHESTKNTDNSQQLVEIIREKVKAIHKAKFTPIEEIGTTRIPSAYTTEKKLGGLMSSASKYNQLNTMSFINAFKNFHFFLNSIREKKEIYFFSAGTYQSIRKYISGGTAMYRHYLTDIGKDLGRCGAVLFIINPLSNFVGESTLQVLAEQSGGTYLEGGEGIIKKIRNIRDACYEISIPGIQEKRFAREITVSSTRSRVTLYSPRFLEEPKQYLEMNPPEKELLVLNLVTQPQHWLIERKISAYNVKINKSKQSKKKAVYAITFPDSYLNQSIDLYKLWMADNNEVTRMEKKSLIPQKNYEMIEFSLTDENIKSYFVLVNGETNTAQVHGKELYEPVPEIAALDEKGQQEILAKMQELEASILDENINKRIGTTNVYQSTAAQKAVVPVTFTGPLKEILEGAAAYCDKLKTSSFHFSCREKVVINRIPLTASGEKEVYISAREAANSTFSHLDKIRRKVYTQIQSYLFGYRFNKQGMKINEERRLISSTDNVKVDSTKVIRAGAFFSERMVFVPIRLLDRSQWGRYDFRFIRNAKWKGQTAAVIEISPKKSIKNTGIYGKLWIDTTDFSLLKIEANPESIPGFTQLNQLAEKLQTKLYLSLETEFEESRGGIRFPTKVHRLEKYKGGQHINKHRGSKGWERKRMIFEYTDYQFVDVEISVMPREQSPVSNRP